MVLVDVVVVVGGHGTKAQLLYAGVLISIAEPGVCPVSVISYT